MSTTTDNSNSSGKELRFGVSTEIINEMKERGMSIGAQARAFGHDILNHWKKNNQQENKGVIEKMNTATTPEELYGHLRTVAELPNSTIKVEAPTESQTA